ncbi:carboxypeptidase regulatory-like domain-containing protein [Pedobacter psychrodurus]|uniref:carboxypeptidase regulatory-like domain-containing protein n=1 Tax=Pedobacter psychrodurus TaxID=2530456 RepID=UPI0029304474|nr:carboxypeptidase regulatory-like domain-containing protein [Pedobacter psychrodurus]
MNKGYYLLGILFLFAQALWAQDKLISDSSKIRPSWDLKSLLEEYVQEHPKEKVFVHFDKSSYHIGDTVWYKVYLINSFTYQLSALSKLVHVEIADTNGHLQKMLLPVEAGMSNGHVVLSGDKFNLGPYKFNVFTRLTGNGSRKYYSFDLKVGTKSDSEAPDTVKVVKLLEFYPEGGRFVADLRSKAVIRSQDAHGNPVSTNGYVVDEENNKVAEFKTGKSGMGLFALSPKREVKYAAILETDASNKHFNLTQVIDSGYVLAVNRILEDTLTVRISKSLVSNPAVLLAFQANGSIVNSIPVTLLSGSLLLKVPIASLPAGMNEVVLFSKDKVLLANRFIFLPEKKSSNKQLTLPKNEYGSREYVSLNLKITDVSGSGITGGYSISVTKVDEELDGNDSRQSILSSLIFSSDTRAMNDHQYVSFDDKSEAGKAELDMQLLTRRSDSYAWNEIFAEKQSQGMKPERSLSIVGKVLKTNGKPMAGAKLNLFSAKDMILIDTVANDQGRFLFENFTILDSSEVVVRVKNLGNEKNVQIILDDQMSNILSFIPDSRTGKVVSNDRGTASIQNPQHGLNSKKGKINQLKTVEIAAKRRPVIPGSVYPVAAAPPDYTIEAEELQKITSLTDYLRSRFIGVKIINNRVIGTCQGGEGPMYILLNGQNIEDLSSIDPRSLIGVQIMKGGITSATMANQLGESMYGQGTCYGIIFLTSNHHNPSLISSIKQTTGIVKVNILGFSASKAFYSPDYSKKTDNIIKDFRSPLFWKPNIITDINGLAKINFYTSDEKGKFQVTLEGIGINGQITREVAFFIVK